MRYAFEKKQSPWSQEEIVTIDENLNKIPNELIYLSSWSRIDFLSSEERKEISHLKINYKAFYVYLKDMNVS